MIDRFPRLCKLNSLERTLRLGSAHESAPHHASALILSHQRGHPEVDSNHIGIVPAGERIERVDKCIALPRPRIARANVGYSREIVVEPELVVRESTARAAR